MRDCNYVPWLAVGYTGLGYIGRLRGAVVMCSGEPQPSAHMCTELYQHAEYITDLTTAEL